MFFRLSLSILNFFQKMSLEFSYHILSTHLAPGLNTSLNILTTGIFLTKEYTFTNWWTISIGYGARELFSIICGGHMEKSYTKKAEIHIYPFRNNQRGYRLHSKIFLTGSSPSFSIFLEYSYFLGVFQPQYSYKVYSYKRKSVYH